MFYIISVADDGTPNIGQSNADNNVLRALIEPPYSIVIGVKDDDELKRMAKQMVDGGFVKRKDTA